MAEVLTKMIERHQKELEQPILDSNHAMVRNNEIGELRGLKFALNYPTQQISSLSDYLKTVKEREDEREAAER